MFKTPPVTTDEVESTQQDKIYSGYVRVLQIYWIIDQTWNQRALNSLLLIMFLTLGAAHRASLVTERTNRCRSEALTRDECGSWALLERKVVVIFLNQTGLVHKPPVFSTVVLLDSIHSKCVFC